MKHNCETVRRLLEDNNSKKNVINYKAVASDEISAIEIPLWVQKHLDGCEFCRSYMARYAALTATLRQELDEAISPLSEPNFSFLNDGLSKISSVNKISSARVFPKKLLPEKLLSFKAAAIVFFLFGFVLSYLGYTWYYSDTLLAEENKLFVEKLYTAPALTDTAVFVSSSEETILPAEWFQVTTTEYNSSALFDGEGLLLNVETPESL
jgi:hypothetical protein